MQKDHADLNTLRASRTHQENTLSYSRRQELGLAVVEQYSIKQMSVSFQSHAMSGAGESGQQSPPPPHRCLPQTAWIPQGNWGGGRATFL